MRKKRTMSNNIRKLLSLTIIMKSAISVEENKTKEMIVLQKIISNTHRKAFEFHSQNELSDLYKRLKTITDNQDIKIYNIVDLIMLSLDKNKLLNFFGLDKPWKESAPLGSADNIASFLSLTRAIDREFNTKPYTDSITYKKKAKAPKVKSERDKAEPKVQKAKKKNLPRSVVKKKRAIRDMVAKAKEKGIRDDNK